MNTFRLTEGSTDTAIMNLGDCRASRAIRVRPGRISILPLGDGGSGQVREFIAATYRETYGADIKVEYPTLISLRTSDGELVAAAGFRHAAREPLFLEQYTGAPVERLLGSTRSRIVEIGNLASRGGGVSLYLFAALSSYLEDRGILHAVVTSTPSLENRLERLGLRPSRLCPADPSRVADGQSWGSYYARQPYVVSGRVDLAVARLRNLFGRHYYTARPRLFPRIHAPVNDR